MLEIKNFSKKYGDKEAVSSLSFVVNDGDIMGFVGKNGAGKTTTLKACMGIITLTEGDILLDGISVVKDPIVCKRSMAYVPDTPRLEEYMTGMQYLNFVCDIYQVPSKERQQNIERLIHAFQMEPHISGLISSYSHGMKQKVALIAAFSHNPKFLVLDEPFVGLDPEAFIALKDQMKMLCRILSGYLLPLVFSAFIGVAGCIANLLFPSFDWENATYIVKRSIPAILNALMSMALSCGEFYILIKHFPKHLFVGNVIVCIIVTILTTAAVSWLKVKGEILYRKL